MKKVFVLALTLALSTTIIQAQTSKKTNTVNNLKTNKMTAKEVVEAYSIALSKGDVPTAFSYFSPDAKWHQPGNNKFSGTKTGLDANGKMLSEMMAVTQGSLAIKPAGAMMVNGNFRFLSCSI